MNKEHPTPIMDHLFNELKGIRENRFSGSMRELIEIVWKDGFIKAVEKLTNHAHKTEDPRFLEEMLIKLEMLTVEARNHMKKLITLDEGEKKNE